MSRSKRIAVVVHKKKFFRFLALTHACLSETDVRNIHKKFFRFLALTRACVLETDVRIYLS